MLPFIGTQKKGSDNNNFDEEMIDVIADGLGSKKTSKALRAEERNARSYTGSLGSTLTLAQGLIRLELVTKNAFPDPDKWKSTPQKFYSKACNIVLANNPGGK